MKSRTLIAVTALLALALAGCADGTADTATGASGTPSAGTSATAPAQSPSGSAGTGQPVGDALLTFTRQGGIAGTNDRLVVRPDGSWTLQTKNGTKEGKLTAAELAALKGALDQVGFAKLPKANGSGNVADGYKYTITYGGEEVVAEDGAVPPALQPVIATLNGLLS